MSPSVSRSNLLSCTIEAVLNRLSKKYTAQSKLSFNDLIELHCLFGNTLIKALEILDNHTITIYRSENNIQLGLEIAGSSRTYTFFSNVNYCTCASFKCSVLIGKSQYTCKHVLVAKLAIILSEFKEKTLKDDTFNYLLSHIKTDILESATETNAQV